MATFSDSPLRPLSLTTIALGIPAALAGGIAWWWERQLLPVEAQQLELDVPLVQQEPPSVPNEAREARQPLQLTADGTGPLFYRRYETTIVDPEQSAEALMARIKGRFRAFLPPILVRVEKMEGDKDNVEVGDEFFIHLFGPWDAPVRVIQSTPNTFAFITLREHLEAGEILFKIAPHPEIDNALLFEIIEWTRSRDRLIDFAYDSAGVLKEFQRGMWVYFCTRVVQESGGRLEGPIRLFTQKSPFAGEIIPEEGKPLWKQHEQQINSLRAKKLNFDREQRHTYTEETGWHLDDYSVELPSEPPGLPIENGSWEIARRIILNYEFPDPDIITGIFVPEDPLEERVLLLKARWLFLTFYFGTRIGDVIDTLREQTPQGPARVWGYSYQTLEDHIEQGEMTFEVWKFLENGQVEFRIHAYSRVADDVNPFYRVGFKLFGRGLQKRYAQRALERMRELVLERLASDQQKPVPAAARQHPEIKPLSADEEAAEKAEDLQEQEKWE